MHAVTDDDELDTHPCYRHPREETALRCISCDRPICVDCVVQAPVGIKCPGCARTPRAARGVVPVGRLVRGLAAGAIVAVVLGGLLAIAPIPFFGIILGYVVGIATGEASRRASGGYRDPHLARGAATVAATGVLLLPALSVLVGTFDVRSLVFQLAAAGFAAYGAYSRAS